MYRPNAGLRPGKLAHRGGNFKACIAPLGYRGEKNNTGTTRGPHLGITETEEGARPTGASRAAAHHALAATPETAAHHAPAQQATSQRP